MSADWRRGEPDCPVRCPLHGRSAHHRHFRLLLPEADREVLEPFKVLHDEAFGAALMDDRAGATIYDFRNRLTAAEAESQRAAVNDNIAVVRRAERAAHRDEDYQAHEEAAETLERLVARRETLRAGRPRVGGMAACYAPALVFGPSPRVGLTAAQCRLLSVLVGETTRNRTRALDRRADNALVFAGDSGEPPVAVPPGLGAGQYVAFNGNGIRNRGHLRGHGYKPATWLKTAGYGEAQLPLLLADLAVLADRLGLTVAGWSRTNHTWKDLNALSALRGGTGDRWLGRCVLRVYTAANFLTRWRRHFADRLGYSYLPGGAEHVVEETTTDGGIHSTTEFQAWMAEEEITDGVLATALGVSQTTVNHYRTGRRP